MCVFNALKSNLLTFFLLLGAFVASAQVSQPTRYELEKKNSYDFAKVLSAGEYGVVIFQETEEHRRDEGTIWQVVVLDTLLQERLNFEVGIESYFIFKGYDLYKEHLLLVFRDGDGVKSDFHIISVNILTGSIDKFEIKNEIELELSHMTVIENTIVFAGYVRFSPTLLSYRLGEENFDVIPGYFKDKSDVLHLRSNENGTFSVLTLEKGYDGHYMRVRTYSPAGKMLFEKEIVVPPHHSLVDAKVTDFVNGNLAVTGTYGRGGNNSAQGFFFLSVKPSDQKEDIQYVGYDDLTHYFDYMGEKRAERMKSKIERKENSGKDFNYSAKLYLHEVKEVRDGFLVAAEVYDPRYERNNSVANMYSPYFNPASIGQLNGTMAEQRYIRRPVAMQGSNEANHFKYLESIVFKIDLKGNVVWDNSLPIDDLDSYSLEKVMAYDVVGRDVKMLYKSEGKFNYKLADERDLIAENELDISLLYEDDELDHDYDGIGGAEHLAGNSFIVWGYQKVRNKNREDLSNRRGVIFVNKINFTSQVDELE
ncbi:hypothetical protein [Fulvivirga ligni]|uniref:hypothetical protein n=1 Tax=Fulvivirga ligni TaxID=2904246 RepID=UPI001F22410A|nr:hypothetical protein [Fulvivirga ligni]UII20445.1 hypothetical protein LVD16_21640 [Fulvivirga ligni]